MWIEEFSEQYILVELTDYCNYNCIMCCHDRKEGPHSFKQGFMTENLFKKIIDELPPIKKPVGLKLFWLGEPFLNPLFSDMLKKCIDILRKKNSGYYIDIHTNAFLMTEEISILLIENSDIIPRITLSLDAYNNSTYKKIRRGGDLDKVVKNIDYFLNKREKSDKKNPGLIFQFIVMNENHKETKEFVDFWENRLNNVKKKKNSILKNITKLSGYNLGKKIGNRLNIETPQDVIWLKRLDTTPEKHEQAENLYINTMEENNLSSCIKDNVEIIVSSYNLWNKEQEVVIRDSFKRRPCSGPWKTPCIRWDGELTVCCFDPSMELSLGNLSNNTFSQLWFGEKIENMRKLNIKGEFDKIKTKDGFTKCLNCSGLDTPFLSDEEIALYKMEKKIEDS
ncbi:MAG: radical SAM protein [Candidatus Muirbacterium halophilum]|nr:radical SAM protein [Candidatus Muirbacterium halophilum]MCK9475117.1 radical SAM protein [Candidatus Muirbacterium halophilum]